MVKQHDLIPPAGARRKSKRVGRGDGSGRGTTSGRGRKGAGSRAGPGPRSGFQGWQNPWIKAMPKIHGFTPPFPKNFAIVNLKRLELHFESDEEVTPARLLEVGLLRDLKLPIKVLGDGEITKPLKVAAHRFSTSAQEKLQAAGGEFQLLSLPEKYRRK